METSNLAQSLACSRERNDNAWAQICAGELLSERQHLVLKSFVEGGPMTANEAYAYGRKNLGAPVSGNGCGSRPAELIGMGVLSVCGERKCTVTNRVAAVMTFDGNLPVKLKKEVGARKPFHLYYDQAGVFQGVYSDPLKNPPSNWCEIAVAVLRRNGKAAITGPLPAQLHDFHRAVYRSKLSADDDQNFLPGLSEKSAAA